MAMDETQEYHLELTLDNSNLADLIQSLENICYAKSQHLNENWQDKDAAKAWDRAGRKLGKLPFDPVIVQVS